RRQGREPVVLPVAQGALVMVTHPKNPLTLTLTIRQLQELWLADQWSDLRAAWPDTPIRRYTPAPESDVYTYYTRQFLGDPLDDTRNTAAKPPPNTTISFDFSDLVQKIVVDPSALAILDYHSYLDARGSFKRIQVDGSTNGDDARLSENYPLQYPLFLYTTRLTLQNKAQVRSFLAFYIMHAERFVDAAQQLPLTPAQLEKSKIQFLTALDNPSLLREFGVVLTAPPPTEGTPP
ncbi:MAG: substrate-binding domain-containing protein, partial [Caldilinea sp.]